jgi:hypothetical protein
MDIAVASVADRFATTTSSFISNSEGCFIAFFMSPSIRLWVRHFVVLVFHGYVCYIMYVSSIDNDDKSINFSLKFIFKVDGNLILEFIAQHDNAFKKLMLSPVRSLFFL